VAAALATGITLGGGAAWFVQALQANASEQAGQAAYNYAENLAAMINAVGSPTKVDTSAMQTSLFEVVDSKGHRVTSCPNRGPDAGAVPFLVPLPQTNEPTDLFVAAPLVAPSPYGYPCSVFVGRTWQVREAAIPALGGRYVVYAAAVLQDSGQPVVDRVRQQLLIGVPLVVLLVAVVAWFAVRGSLRPVAAITAKVGEINATDLRERVPVPRTGDELTELATTMNDMLRRVAESVDRQHQFVADASHELRTPLTSMRTQLEVLFAHPDRIDWRHATDNVALDVERMQQLVADLLLLARLEAQPPVRDQVDLADLAATAVRDRSGQPGIAVTTGELAPLTVAGSRAQLARLVGNLVDNATRHARTAVTVSVAVSGSQQIFTARGAVYTSTSAGPHAVLVVADDGPGIPMADRQRVFDRFVRLDEDRSLDSGGTGLGLAIVRDIAAAHGGIVTVADNGPGARFVVTLPLPD
jgi:signal transduction histidine kinase